MLITLEISREGDDDFHSNFTGRFTFFSVPPSSNLPPHVYNCPSNDSLSDNSLRSRIFPIKSENFSLSLFSSSLDKAGDDLETFSSPLTTLPTHASIARSIHSLDSIAWAELWKKIIWLNKSQVREFRLLLSHGGVRGMQDSSRSTFSHPRRGRHSILGCCSRCTRAGTAVEIWRAAVSERSERNWLTSEPRVR